ncbi:uncharacterized protein LOC128963365 [Oppia nitens]|uniref:uncharacterized protein LOC128963365 n=1 Tax=Oppia nitens TaxID=1686743 RepID=UPI0023DC3983|nr:uncharacterized protein LOC128963365 [Oppia nitens]
MSEQIENANNDLEKAIINDNSVDGVTTEDSLILRSPEPSRPAKHRQSITQQLPSFVTNKISLLVSFLLSNILSICCIVIGSVYINQCPHSPKLPRILIINGTLNIVLLIVQKFRIFFQSKSVQNKVLYITETILLIASIFTFIIWIIFVYNINPEYDETIGPIYCNQTLYLFAFWLPTIIITFAIFLLALTCCFVYRGFKIVSN